eukprot:TRINITY_DN26181_c0_g1_i1.p2 TRINITY_DN26181_c0_g1~~TRINITY_DN26181_c0_g1_i1.p2  ORF type:complete len:292 (+),score=80.01 TRINITY_DN26181_c0_g1_i1:50-925(+)
MLDAESVLFMSAVSLQVGLQPILTQRCIGPGVSKDALVMIENGIKVLLVLCMIDSSVYSGWSATDSMWTVGLPGVAYAFSGLLKHVSYQNADGVTFNLVNQTKVVFSAVLVWLLLGDAQSERQMQALGVITMAAVILSWPRGGSSRKGPALKGVLAGLGAAGLSGLGGTLAHVAIRSKGRDSNVFSLELALWGNLALLATGQLGTARSGLFRGFGIRTMIPPIVQAIGGLCVGRVIRLQGSVTMSLCTVVGIAVAAIAKRVFNGEYMSGAQWVAAALVVPGVLVHTGALQF